MNPVSLTRSFDRAYTLEHEIADCTALIVTYNSAPDLAGLLDTLPAAADGLRLGVVVVDNDSSDDVARVAAERPNVQFVAAGANLGYSGAINLGRRHLGVTRAVLVLNPDVRLAPGSVRRLLDVVEQPGVGVAVPRLLDHTGALFQSLRREPSLSRALGDALLGRRWPHRPGWLSEMVWPEDAYQDARDTEWSTGAALLISNEVDATVGPWDDGRFFLYCEETDYLRRVRQAGYTVRYVPEAVVTHRGGGSGGGTELMALHAVNRVRYFRKYHGRLAGAAYRWVVVLEQLLRCHRPGNRFVLRTILSRRRWAQLPGQRKDQRGQA